MSLPSAGEWLSYALLAGAIAVDAGPWLLSMLARPLPCATLLGLLWGDPATGALVGAALELIYAGILPVGAARYPEAGLAGLAGAGVALASAGVLGTPSVLAGLLWGLAAGEAGKAAETWRRGRNAAGVAAARRQAAAGHTGALRRLLAGSIALTAALGAAAATALLALGLVLAAPFVDAFPEVLALRPPPVLFAALASGAVLRLWSGRSIRAALAAGLAAGLVVCLAWGGEGG